MCVLKLGRKATTKKEKQYWKVFDEGGELTCKKSK